MRFLPCSRQQLLRSLCLLLAAGTAPVRADSAPAPAAEVEAVRAELAALRAEYEARLAALEARLAGLEQPPAPTAESVAAAAEAAPPEPPPPAPAAPLTIASGAGGRNFLNLSLDGLFAVGGSTTPEIEALEPGGHDPAQRGFTVQNVEVVLDGAVDPYLRGQANVVLQLTPEGETVVELEEAYVTTSSLPAGLQLKAGQFLTEFGRLNASHPHSWDFVDQPLVNARFFGPDGLRSAGARLSWLLPTSFYSEAFLAVQNSGGETLHSFRSVAGESLFGREIEKRKVSGVDDLLYVPRYAASFDLTDEQTLLVGASAALGPNGSGDGARTAIYGLDGFWKWKSPSAFQGFPFFKVQGELMQREYELAERADAGLAAADLRDWGGYLQLNWGYRPGRVLGLRYDRVGGDTGAPGDPGDPGPGSRWRLSPAFTWFPSEYSKLRLQYNFDRGDEFTGDEHSLWLQLEFLLGAHSAHKF
ncbi:MAG: hypothetical protein AB7G12_04295 [Thermoanaerobaculia bacterium]